MRMTRRLVYPGQSPILPALGKIKRMLAKAKAAEPLEFEQIVIRYAVGVVITGYSIVSYATGEIAGHSATIIAALLSGAWALGFSFLIHLVLWPHRRLERRSASIVADAVELSLLLGIGGISAAIFFPVYLWVTLGNGFRFGLNAMYAAIVVNCGSFLIMASVTPYWRDAWQFTAGLALAIVIIPFYVAKLIRNLRKAMSEAEAASTAKTEFLSMMSHELRTPLNAILGLAQLSKITAATTEQRFSAMSTELAAGRLLRMVDTILEFQRVEGGAAERRDRAFDLLDMLNEVRAIIEPLTRQKRLDFRIRFTTGLPELVRCDPDHIQTIILNLTTNAVKYTRHGSVWLEIGLTSDAFGPRLRIEVRDTGGGISPATQSRIFDRFVRAQEHNASAEPGVGLGLAMCKSLTELLGGSLGCESTVGKGSLFWAELPVWIDVGGPAVDRPAAVATASSPVLWIAPTESEVSTAAPGATLVHDVESLRRVLADPDALADFVFVADAEVLTPDLQTLLAAAMTNVEHPPSLVLFGPQEGALSLLRPLAMAASDARGANERAALVATGVRWHWRLARHLTADAPTVTILARRLAILVADDNALNRDVTRRMLELDGHSVVLAETGDEALQHMLDGEIEFALLDVNMPGLSGIEVCQTYQAALGSEASIPVVGVTADISSLTRDHCLKAGMADVLGKPVTMQQLRQAVSGHMTMPAGLAGCSDTDRSGIDRPCPADVDVERIAFLRQLFGEEKLRSFFLPGFRRDIAHNLALLKQGVSERRPKLIRDALHAIRSSAGTAGASHLYGLAASFEKTGREADVESYERGIQASVKAYCALIEGEEPTAVTTQEQRFA